MEEGRAEEGRPPERGDTARHGVDGADTPGLVQLEHGRPYGGHARGGPDPCELSLEPSWHGDVVGVEASNVGAARVVETPVQRRRQTSLLVVAKHANTGVLESG